MELHLLERHTQKAKRRLGQGHGSGRVKTAGRGTKGQKARGHIPLRFEGGALPLIKRLPFLRGKTKNKSFLPRFAIVNITDLNTLPSDSVVDVALLVKHNILSARESRNGVKILGDGDVTKALVIKIAVSKSAEEKIVKAGGRIENA